MNTKFFKFYSSAIISGIAFIVLFQPQKEWQSRFVHINKNGTLQYFPDEKGNIIPDFSRVGYQKGTKAIPFVPVVKTIAPPDTGSSETIIQAAIDELAKRIPGKDGFKGAILLKKGIYKITGSVKIQSGGIVLRGEGDGTILIATGNLRRPLINVSGTGNMEELANTRVPVRDEYIPAGSNSFIISSSNNFAAGDKIIVFRPGTKDCITDLRMDVIEAREGTRQWQANEYDLRFERTITAINGNRITIDNPIVMPMEKKYGGAFIYKYEFKGRISNVGIENLQCRSEFANDTSENHSWDAVQFDKIENGWIRNITARYF